MTLITFILTNLNSTFVENLPQIITRVHFIHRTIDNIYRQIVKETVFFFKVCTKHRNMGYSIILFIIMPNNAHPTPSSMVHFTKYYHTTSMIGSLDQSNQSILQTKASRIIL